MDKESLFKGYDGKKKRRKKRKIMAKKRVFKDYKKRKGGQHYWVGRKGIAKSIRRMHPEMTEREASHMIDMTFDGIKTNLKREKRYSQPGFGTFRLKHRKAKPARMGRNPFSGEPVRIKARPAMKIVRFSPAKSMKMEFR